MAFFCQFTILIAKWTPIQENFVKHIDAWTMILFCKYGDIFRQFFQIILWSKTHLEHQNSATLCFGLRMTPPLPNFRKFPKIHPYWFAKSSLKVTSAKVWGIIRQIFWRGQKQFDDIQIWAELNFSFFTFL